MASTSARENERREDREGQSLPTTEENDSRNSSLGWLLNSGLSGCSFAWICTSKRK